MKHDLCVIAGKIGFCHTGSAVCIETCQQDTGFDLSRSNFGLIVNAVELTLANAKRLQLMVSWMDER